MLVIDKKGFHPFLNESFKRMKRGQTSWLKIGQQHHKGGYHTLVNLKKRYMTEKIQVGQTIWLKVEVGKIKRDEKCPKNADYPTKISFCERIREICKELVGFEEYSNAAELYARGVQELWSISKL